MAERKSKNIKKTSFNMDVEVERKLKLLSVVTGKTMSELLEEAINDYIEKNKDLLGNAKL